MAMNCNTVMLIFLVDAKELELEPELFEQCLQLVRNERKVKINQIKTEKNRKLSVLAGMLLNYGTGVYIRDFLQHEGWEGKELIHVSIKNLIESYNCSYDYILGTEENGKPIFAEKPQNSAQNICPYNIHFNLSHSGHYVVCAVGNRPVGIDIEGERKIKLSTAKRFFSPAEFQWVCTGMNQMQQEKNIDFLQEAALSERLMTKDMEERFLRIWTMKEAYSKVTGIGIAYGISKAEFLPQPNQNEKMWNAKLQMVNEAEKAIDASKSFSWKCLEKAVEGYRIAVIWKSE